MTIHPLVFPACLIAMAFALSMFLIKRSRFRRWRKVAGRVVEHVHRENNDGETMLAPKVKFQTGTGEDFAFVSTVSSTSPPSVGAMVSVLYDPNNPSAAVVDGFFYRHLGEVVVIILGLAGVLVYLFQKLAA